MLCTNSELQSKSIHLWSSSSSRGDLATACLALFSASDYCGPPSRAAKPGLGDMDQVRCPTPVTAFPNRNMRLVFLAWFCFSFYLNFTSSVSFSFDDIQDFGFHVSMLGGVEYVLQARCEDSLQIMGCLSWWWFGLWSRTRHTHLSRMGFLGVCSAPIHGLLRLLHTGQSFKYGSSSC